MKWILLCLILILTVAVYYLPISQSKFLTWDDDLYVFENKELQDTKGWYWIWIENRMPNPYPITFSVLRLEYLAFGLDPALFHWGNLSLHLLNIVLFALFLHKLKISALIASFSVAVYALHPVQVETVMWVSEIKNLLSAGFYWLSWLAFLHYLEVPEKRKRYYALGVSLFIFSLASKSMTVTLPVSLTLWLWFFHRNHFKSFFLRFLPLWFLSIAFGLLSIHSENKFYHSGHQPVLSRTLFEKMADVTEALCFYSTTFFYPRNLSCIYPHHPILGSQLWVRYGATIVFVCGILILIKITFFSKHKQQTQILFFFWNFGIVAGPILGWFATSYMQLSRVSDRYNYHSLPFLSLGLALWGAHYLKLLTPLQQRSLTILFLGFLSFLIFCTAQQTQVWSTPISLWIQASKINPQETEVFYNLALSYLSEKKVENAMRAFEETLKIEPRHYKANNNYGNLLAEQGRNEEAIRHLKIAARVHPEEWTAHNNLAHIYHGLGKKEEAIPHYRKSLNNPDRSFVYNVTSLELADILREKAELLKENQNTVFSEAIDCFKMALQGDEKQRAFEGLGLCYLKTDPQKAEECFQKSIQFAKSKNSSSIAWMNLYRLFHGQKQ